jgi:DNA-binding PadR family transcriptional regulator
MDTQRFVGHQLNLKPKDRQSFEYTVLAILEYFVRHESLGPLTKYHIMNRVPGLATQRQDRVSEILDLLVTRGWIALEKRERGNAVYRITQEGRDEYQKWIREFLSFVKILRNKQNGNKP